MMKRIVLYTGLVFSAWACSVEGLETELPSGKEERGSEGIEISCSVTQLNGRSSGIPTKAIIGQTTTTTLDGNFVKLDEVRNREWLQDDYVAAPIQSWNNQQTRILDASIFATPDNTENIHFRSVVFNPRQTYPIHSYFIDNNQEDSVTVGYITRMVGWYPKTYTLQMDDDGTPSDTPLTGIGSEYFRTIGGKDCIIFENKLDGQTDVMMTDMREGRYDVRNFGHGFKNNENDYDVQPYGHQFIDDLKPNDGFRYCNYFTFNHYLTGIRLFIHAEGTDLSLIGYKQITDVVFTDQPSSVAIALPKVQNRTEETSTIITPGNGVTVSKTLPIEGVEPIFGEAMHWWGEKNIPIIKTAMAEDPDYPEFADVPTYPVLMENTVSMDKVYLGYILVRPDCDTELEIHTDAGLFYATISHRESYRTVNEAGETVMVEEEILKAGHIYNITIDVRADGSLDVIMDNENEDSFKNLSPYNTAINDFEYSNCYVIKPETMVKDAAAGEFYDGFYFQAITPGRGQRGMISVAGAELYPKETYFEPHSARILWQDHPRLIKHVELLHGYIRFVLNDRCKSETDRLTGNAVLAVYDASGEILWTWHIWVTDELEDLNISNGSTTFSVMNMNLGATKASMTSTDTAEEAIETYGLYYQWGRKDPSPGPSHYRYAQADLSTKTYYYMDHGAKNSVSEHFEPAPTVETGVKYPLDIIAPSTLNESYANDWLYSTVDQLWGFSPAQNKLVRKTIYDPCPYGYRVPDEELADWFRYCREAMGSRAVEVEASDGSIVGVQLYGSGSSDSGFFPYTGWRGHDKGRTDKTHAWFMVGEFADYQSAAINSTNKHRRRALLIRSDMFTNGRFSILNGSTYSNRVDVDHTNRTSLSPVRCVRYNGAEEEPED